MQAIKMRIEWWENSKNDIPESLVIEIRDPKRINLVQSMIGNKPKINAWARPIIEYKNPLADIGHIEVSILN